MTEREIIESFALSNSIPVPDGAVDRLLSFAGLMLEKNKVMNLTAITDPADVAERHMADSLAVLACLRTENAGNIIDVGCGAGFPGMPVKLWDPSLSVTLLDSQKKRTDFILSALCEAGIDAPVITARAEDAARLPDMRASFGTAVSRAVAPMNILSELCLPFVREGGLFLSMKSADFTDELDCAKRAIKTLGGTVERIFEYTLQPSGIKRVIIAVRKTRPTPDAYPRRFARIKASPL